MTLKIKYKIATMMGTISHLFQTDLPKILVIFISQVMFYILKILKLQIWIESLICFPDQFFYLLGNSISFRLIRH